MSSSDNAVQGSSVAPNTGWNLECTYTSLPKAFFEPAMPARVTAPKTVLVNHQLAAELGLNLDALPEARVAALFSGQELPPNAQPIAQAYAGHQFGGFTMLGDGRAILLGEQRTPSGQLFDIQFKGSGQTHYSRRGDGRAALGPMLREYIISEAMSALGIPSTRSLAVVTTGDPVYREAALRGAVLTRVAASHIRVGTFQYAATRRDESLLRPLADYTIARHFPALDDQPDRYLQLLRTVASRQALLIAGWQLVGFVHGVMNTDNMAVSGETIDYGPCAFMDAYHPDTVFSSIDHGGRYAYGQQPAIAQWNLARLAETLVPLLDPDRAKAIELATGVLNEFGEEFQNEWLKGMRSKLGLQSEQADDVELIEELLTWMQTNQADFTITFAALSTDDLLMNSDLSAPEFQTWRTRWTNRLNQEGTSIETARRTMQRVNPVVIPRNHRVEEALAAANQDDLSVLQRLLSALSQPYDYSAATQEFRTSPPSDQCRYRTFCGT
jgi:uncharacterized protein YdiU (UPF0061 family)